MTESNQISLEQPLKIYFEETDLYKLGIFKHGSGMIYHKEVADNDLRDYKLLVQEVDDIISINRKQHYKQALKDIIGHFCHKAVTKDEAFSRFFTASAQEEVCNMIQERTGASAAFAKRIYTQLYNRIRFRHAGIYTTNSDAKKLRPKFLSSYDVLRSKIEFVNRRKRWFDDDFLWPLQAKLQSLKSDFEEEYVTDEALEPLSLYFDIALYEVEDKAYQDAIEILKYFYFEEMNEDSKYPNPDYRPYEYSLHNEDTPINRQKTLHYIQEYNKSIPTDPENTDEEQAYFHPIEEDVYHDESLKDEVRLSAMATELQFDKFYDDLLDEVLFNPDDTVFCMVKKYVMELIEMYEELKTNNVFLGNGNINEYSSYLSDYRKAVRTALAKASSPNESIDRILSEVLREKKREWKLLYSEINKDDFYYDVVEFDCHDMKFHAPQIPY